MNITLQIRQLMRLDIKGVICDRNLEPNEQIKMLADSGHQVQFVDQIESVVAGFIHYASLTNPAMGEYSLKVHRKSGKNRLPRGVLRRKGLKASVLTQEDGLKFVFYR